MKEINKSADTKPNKEKYSDIINLPHHVSTRHSQMSLYQRAAQFSPFAALTGHDAAIKEVARLTETRIELDENSKMLLDEKLVIVKDRLDEKCEIKITYFEPDIKKSGGSYVEVNGSIKKIDEYKRLIVLHSGKNIPIDEIIAMEGEIFLL
ncbi:MAG: hypothetical protein RR495_07035 [Anaerovoracaceae bacterium]